MRFALLLLVLGLAAGCGGGGKDEGSADTLAFAGVPWILSGGVGVPGGESVRPTATFANGTVSGSTGCNQYSGPYTLDGDALHIGRVVSTLIGCPAPRSRVESAFLAKLAKVERWKPDGAELVLLDGGGSELLRFALASPEGSWEATSIQTGSALTSPLPGTRITARLAGGTISGSAGCNSYHATYTTKGDTFEITRPVATRKLCAEPKGVMQQEAAYLAALPTTTQYLVDADSLALLRADGTFVAAFVPVGAH